MQGGTAATQTVFIEHVGIPTLAAVRQAVDALEDLNMASLRGKPPLELERAGIPLEPWAPEDLLARAEAFGMARRS